MKMYTLAAIAVVGTYPNAATAPLPEPIAKAGLGQMQCTDPDESRKTCSSLASYEVIEDGKILSKSVALVQKSPGAVMEAVTPVVVKDGRVCGTLLQSQIDAAKFSATGQSALSDEQISKLRQLMTKVSAIFKGREMCSAYKDFKVNMAAEIFLDGEPLNLVIPWIWVRNDEGYQVRP